ncbi:MAG: sulfite exporter TauE/SafE family protein [Planctomycetes bacterium]|nr:sulfite exporter TauE/SafE family protein [Planctomycetota bacterium]
MELATVVVLCAAFLAIAALYSSVGHAGASGYLATMALLGVAPEQMKPTALLLNIVVATLGVWRFVRAGLFSWRLFWPFGLATVPMAFLGGRLAVSPALYKPLLGLVLLAAAARLLLVKGEQEIEQPRPPRVPLSLAVGGAIGLLSGITGTGGGIFLSPLALLRRWARIREISALSSVYILVTSIAGLLGHRVHSETLPRELPWFAAAVLVGGLLGSSLGVRRLDPLRLRQALGAVLVIAGGKLLIEGAVALAG